MARIVPATQYRISVAANVLRDGGLVAMPTETVYGLAANALDSTAVSRIFEAKGRPATNPLIVHIGAVDQAEQITLLDEARERFQALAAAFWPGPLTLVLPKRAGIVPDQVTAGGPTIAVRFPAHPIALALIDAAGVPLAAPSANRSEAISPTRPEHVAESLGDAIDLILDGGPCRIGLESTVLSLVEPNNPRLLRPGAITPEQIAAVLGVMPTCANPSLQPPGTPLTSPGQMRRHYAPMTRLIISDNLAHDLSGFSSIGVIARTDDLGATGFALPPTAALRLLPSDPEGYSRELYDALREMDSDPLVKTIVLQAVPDTPEWRAVQDRLTRASAS